MAASWPPFRVRGSFPAFLFARPCRANPRARRTRRRARWPPPFDRTGLRSPDLPEVLGDREARGEVAVAHDDDRGLAVRGDLEGRDVAPEAPRVTQGAVRLDRDACAVEGVLVVGH